MFIMSQFFVIYFIILGYTNTLPINHDGTTTLSLEGQVEAEMLPFSQIIQFLEHPPTRMLPYEFLKRGIQLKSKLDMLARRAVQAAVKADKLLINQGILENEKNAVELELKRIKAPLSVRERIEFWENMLSPAFKQTKQFTNTEDEIGFHENRWLFILNNRQDDPMVKRLLAFIESRRKDGMSKEIFARRIAGFFHFTSNKIHVPPLESYTTGELKQELESFFGESYDNLTLDVVCALRKESP